MRLTLSLCIAITSIVSSLSNHNMLSFFLLTPLKARLAANTLDYHLLIFSVK